MFCRPHVKNGFISASASEVGEDKDLRVGGRTDPMDGDRLVEPSPPQPNVPAGSWRTLPPLFWVLLIATGVFAGVGGGLLMLLLRGVQHMVWEYRPGDNFLSAVENTQPMWIILAVSAAGLIAGVTAVVLQDKEGREHGAELV